MSTAPHDEVQFADGFDAPDRLAFGLNAVQLAVVAIAAVLAFLTIHSLPLLPGIPLALLLGLAGAALGWLRFAGRPAVDWALFAVRFLLRPRQGTIEFVTGDAAPGRSLAADEVRERDGWRTSRRGVDGVVGGPRHCDRRPVVAKAGRGRSVAADEDGGSGVSLPKAAFAATGRPLSAHPMRPYVVRDEPPHAQRAEATNRRPRIRRGGAHRITFFSLKGGTGRTTLATELALQLAAGRTERHRVALVDLDLRAPSVGPRLGLHAGGIVDFATAVPDERRATEHLTQHRSNVAVMLGADRAVSPEWPVTPAVVRELLRELDMEGFAVVVIDVAPELSSVTECVLRSVDDVFIVLTPTASGIHDAYRTTELLRRQGLRHQLRYVINRVRDGGDVSEAMHDLGGQVIAEIPDDNSVTDAENAHLAASAGRSPAAHALQRFARRVSNEISWSCED